MESELIVPGRPQQLAADTALTPLAAEQGRSDPTQQAQVLRGRAVLEPAVILPKDHVQHPVQAVLDAPVASRRAAQFLSAATPAADVMGHLEGFLAPFPRRPRYPHDGLHIDPLLTRTQPPRSYGTRHTCSSSRPWPRNSLTQTSWSRPTKSASAAASMLALMSA